MMLFGIPCLLFCEGTDFSSSPASCASKVRGTFLPQEYELAKFICDIENPDLSWSTETSACEWYGVECNGEGEVIRIRWHDRSLCGTPHWKYLPQSLFFIDLINNMLSGPVDFSALPLGLGYMYIQVNLFSGDLRFEILPAALIELNLSRCRFSGHVDLSNLVGTPLYQTDSYLNILGNPELTGSVRNFDYPRTWHIPDSFLSYFQAFRRYLHFIVVPLCNFYFTLLVLHAPTITPLLVSLVHLINVIYQINLHVHFYVLMPLLIIFILFLVLVSYFSAPMP